jgi:GT2 family glycosyltransferase
MSKNLFAFCTFGLTQFSKLAVESIRNTVKNEYDIFIIVGKPGDSETLNWLATEPNIKFKVHTENMGFPVAVNDIYDFAWKENNYDNLILMGNDVILYDFAADSLIDLANSSDYKMISGLQYDVRDLVKDYPETARHFHGDNYIIEDFSGKPWEAFKPEFYMNPTEKISEMQLYDIQNLCLYKRDVFDRIGYTDVNFYPAYFVDNDYAKRISLAGIKCCTLMNARFFHFWSRVFKQGSGGSTDYYFESNERYYMQKWGGEFGKETKTPPIEIFSRDNEQKIVAKWRYYGEMRR